MGSVAATWFSNGFGGKNVAELATQLQRLGSLEIVSDEADALPIVLSPPNRQSAKLSVPVRRFDTTVEATPVVRARAADGRLLVEKVAKFTAGEERTEVVFDLPLELRNSLSRIDVRSHETAASVVLLDGRWQRRSVGLVSSRPRDSGHALLSEVFFIKRAVSPFSEIFHQPIAKLTAAECSVIVLPDGEKLETGDQANLDAWIRARRNCSAVCGATAGS